MQCWQGRLPRESKVLCFSWWKQHDTIFFTHSITILFLNLLSSLSCLRFSESKSEIGWKLLSWNVLTVISKERTHSIYWAAWTGCHWANNWRLITKNKASTSSVYKKSCPNSGAVQLVLRLWVTECHGLVTMDSLIFFLHYYGLEPTLLSYP